MEHVAQQMGITTKSKGADAIASILPVGLWHELAHHVADYKPDVVVLVARKMPRIREALDLVLWPGAIEITDWAIPFCHNILHKARIAIVDDVINRGTTVLMCRRYVEACGAAEVKFFALACTNRSDLPQSELQCATNDNLNDDNLADFANRVPEALYLVNKPFDLGFPIIPCSFAVPARSTDDIYGWLRSVFGPGAVQNPTSHIGYKHRFSRLSVDLANGEPGIQKIRLYIDEKRKECNIVPFCIPPVLSSHNYAPTNSEAKRIESILMEPLANAPEASMLWPDEAKTRVQLFIAGLELGIRTLDMMKDVFVLSGSSLFDEYDAGLSFGPITKGISTVAGHDQYFPPAARQDYGRCNSPFFNKCSEFSSGTFYNTLRKTLPATIETVGLFDIELLFDRFFTELSHMVGATNHEQYSLNWPYTKSQIMEIPYLRLRIGPTFDDLVEIMFALLKCYSNMSRTIIRSLVNNLLDRFIDEGVVVPTIALYECQYYRIYRKGEADHSDKAIQRALLSLDHLARPISRTRLAKLLTILTYSSRVETCLVPTAEERGYVPILKPDLLTLNETEITNHLIVTGSMKKS